jgi:hypothetical protein
MTLLIIGLLTAVLTVVGFLNWRLGLLAVIAFAAVQDPLRKLVPGTPGYLALMTAPVFLAAVIGSRVTTRAWWSDFARRCPRISAPLTLFAILCIPAAVISATYGQGSWMLTLLGALSYSIIFLAIVCGFHFARRGIDVRSLMVAYCAIHGVMLVGGYLEFMGFFENWKILSDKALGFSWIRHKHGYAVTFIAGFYRSGDVMGWHAAAVSCLSMILAIGTANRARWLWVGVSIFAIGALLMCGRRKMVFMLPVFLLMFGWMQWQIRKPGRLLSLGLLISIPVVALIGLSDRLSEEITAIRYYKETAGESLDSLEEHGLGAVIETVRQNGFLGTGLGTATPGSHHLNVERPRNWQESGSSRVVAELGIPGTFGLMLVMFGIVVTSWRIARESLRTRSALAPYSTGLLAFFVANVASLTVSGQILADPFIASFLGIMVGLVLSTGRLNPDMYTSRFAKPAPNLVEGQHDLLAPRLQ